MNDPVRSLTSGKLLAHSAAWNLAGMMAPMVVGVLAIPLLISGMGEERFGLLAIIWMGVGYFSLFDLGLGRSLTKFVAERMGRGEVEALGLLIWTALYLLAILGLVGATAVWLVASPLVEHVLNVEPVLRREAIASFRILACGLPAVIVTAALIGLLEAHQRFRAIAAVRIPLGVLTFAAPLATLQVTPSLVWATGALVISRVAALAAYFAVTRSVEGELRAPSRPRRDQAALLFQYGGWLTVTNVVGPLMTYLDRFFVGALLTMTAVTYYATPYEVLSRLQMLPNAVMGVLFPAMSTAVATDRARLVELYGQSGRLLMLMMLPLAGGAFLLAPEALDLWLGGQFRMAATPVVQWLALGLMVNTLAKPAFTVLQSTGRPDLVAKAHLGELVPYLAGVWFLTSTFGIAGTAAAWSCRVVFDTAILNELAGSQLPELRRFVVRTRVTGVAILSGFAAAWMIESFLARVLVLTALVTVSGLLLWPVIKRALRHQPPAPAP